MNKKYTKYNIKGFSLVEIIIVIVVVSLLATITSVSYAGIRRRADIESVKADLLAASSRLSIFKSDNGTYPATIDCNQSNSDTNLCIKASKDDITLHYNISTTVDIDTYGLTAVKNNDNNISYRTVTGSEPILCPIGFIVVPGSKTYGTGNFCIMKYEAKQVGTTELPESVPAGLPFTGVNQFEAIDFSRLVCSDCHLVSEAEWMTLAQNVLNVDSNWDNDAGTHKVGVGYIYPGHSDNEPSVALEANVDSEGYSGTGQTSGKQRRTLSLSNGEIIWDMSGNVYEWTSLQTSGGQPGVVGGGWARREWTAVTADGSLSIDPSPKGTGITGAALWTSSNKIGQVESSYEETSLRGTVRSGSWESPDRAGVLCLNFVPLPTSYGPKTGFRVTASQ